jgi:hypothetical protein
MTFDLAWELGDKPGFQRARAKVKDGIGSDLSLTKKETAFLLAAIAHLNPDDHWSCWAAAETLAAEAGVSLSVGRRATKKARGRWIQTREARMPGNRFPTLYITLHRVSDLTPSKDHRVSVCSSTECQNGHSNLSSTNPDKNIVRLSDVTQVYIEPGTPQWLAWSDHYKTTKGLTLTEKDCHVEGRIRPGRMFPTEWPSRPAQCVGAAATRNVTATRG